MFNKPPNSRGPVATEFSPSPAPAASGDPAPRKGPKMASLLAQDLTIEGDISGEGELHVDGVVRGDIRAPRLSIGEGGRVEGAIHAEAVEVRGRVLGSITAKQVRLMGSSHVEGDITHEQLTMETGAHFQGRSLKFQRHAPDAAPADAPVLSLASPANAPD